MQTRIDAKRELYAFESLAELARWIETTPRTWAYEHSDRDKEPEYRWDLNTSYAQAWKMAREGWPEGAQGVQNALKVFAPTTRAPGMKNDFYGHMPHVPRFCAGAPDNMIRHDTKIAEGRVLTLVVPISVLAKVNAQCMANYGVALTQYTQQMEMQGIRVEINAIQAGDISGKRIAFAHRVKAADQPIDLSVVAFAIGHPAAFRRLGFALIERCGARQTESYGQHGSAVHTDLINPTHGTVILNGMAYANECAQTPEAAFEGLTIEINKAMEESFK